MRRPLLGLLAATAVVTANAAPLQGGVYGTDSVPVAAAFVTHFSESMELLSFVTTGNDGRFTIDDGVTGGFIAVQPQAPVDDQGYGVYTHEPRTFAWADETSATIMLPEQGWLVLRGYDTAGKLLRWSDYEQRGLTGGQCVCATDLDDRMQPAGYWPLHDSASREQGAAWSAGLPGIAIPPDTPRVVNVLFWEVPGYGKLLLRADNGGSGYSVQAGRIREVDVNVELARTAVADLVRRVPELPESAAADVAAIQNELAEAMAVTDSVARAAAADTVLAKALERRDAWEFDRARAAISEVRRGALTVRVVDSAGNPLSGAQVTAQQLSHDFLFGAYDGTPHDTSSYELARDAGFELATVLPAWGWTQLDGQTMDAAVIDAVLGISALKGMGFRVKAHGTVWMQDYGILPEFAYTMDAASVPDAVRSQQRELLGAFANQMDLWEAMNEPATTNAIDLPYDAMTGLVGASAADIKAAGVSTTLVNGPHELNYGAKYRVYGLDNAPLDDYPETFSEFLSIAAADGQLDDVDAIGLQFYPGSKLNTTMFNGQDGPAMTPAWFVDLLARYEQFGKPIHITEFCVRSYHAPDWGAGYWREPWTESTQADYAEAIFTMAFADPNVDALTWWDLLDTNASTITGGLIDAYGQKKPAYTRIKNLIAGWTTNESVLTDATGKATINGYGGEYAIHVRLTDGRELAHEFHLARQTAATLSFTFEAAGSPNGGDSSTTSGSGKPR